MTRLLGWLTNLFPLWVVLACGLALVEPTSFAWFNLAWIPYALAIIMLGMGITLGVDDFRRVFAMPRAVAAGFAAQYLIMPFLGWFIARMLRLPAPLAVGLILVACCPGGTASNVVTYLAGGHVALSVLMTMCSTFGAVAMTPLLTQWLAGTRVPVPTLGLFLSTLQVVLAPLLIGVFLHHFTPRLVRAVLPVAPLVSVLTIMLICASIIGQNAAAIREGAWRLMSAVFLLHAGGFALGYLVSRVLGQPMRTARTVSIEVGMQNSGLGVVLARKHFADPLTAVPSAISSVFHSIIGSFLAAWWRWRDRNPPRTS